MRRSVDFRMQEKQLLDKILGPKVYDRRIRPGSPGNGTQGKVLNCLIVDQVSYFLQICVENNCVLE